LSFDPDPKKNFNQGAAKAKWIELQSTIISKYKQYKAIIQLLMANPVNRFKY